MGNCAGCNPICYAGYGKKLGRIGGRIGVKPRCRLAKALVEYKFEAYDMFESMVEAIEDDVVRYIYRVNIVTQVEDRLAQATAVHGDEELPKEPLRNKDAVGRNDACPCGSGKKYKKCCGAK